MNMADSENVNYRPIKRIRQACQNCRCVQNSFLFTPEHFYCKTSWLTSGRRKKARCPGNRPECSFCVRLGQPCSYSDDEVPPPNQSSSKRLEPANEQDFSSRLSAIENQLADVVQTVKGIATTIQTMQVSKNANADPNTNDGITLDGSATQNLPFKELPPIEIIMSAADLYFRYCHNQPYSLFHEESFRNKLALGEVPTHLLFALLASTVRYSTEPYFEDKIAAVSAYAHQSWKAIVMPWNGIQSDAELSIVQTILLLAIIDYTDGRTQGSWIKVGLAIRLAQDFRLMVEPDKILPPVQQEERRRVFWSFYLCDKLISCGQERPSAILDSHCKLQLPGDENEWRNGHYQQTPTLEQVPGEDAISNLSTLSPFALTIVMASLLGRCAQYALGEQEEQGPGGKNSPWSPRSKYSVIHSALLQLESELGLNDSLSKRIADNYMSPDGSVDQHRAAPLVLAHALFFLCQCLLYHPFLLKRRLAHLGQRTPQSFLTQTFHSCRSAASSLSSLMDEVKSLCCETLTTFYDPFYGYCTMVAGTIHSMFLQASDPVIVETARESFKSSMQNLVESAYYWKSCGMMKSRLEDFHASSERYATLVDPMVQEIHLTPTDVNDLFECLDYSRMSTTPRRKSQASMGLATLSQLPSPFFDEFVNLLPLSYSRPVSTMPLDSIFSQAAPVFDPQWRQPNSMFNPVNPSGTPIPANGIGAVSSRTGGSTTSLSPTSTHTNPGSSSTMDRERGLQGPRPSTISSRYSGSQEQSFVGRRRLTSPSDTMKRPWYERDVPMEQDFAANLAGNAIIDDDTSGINSLPPLQPGLR